MTVASGNTGFPETSFAVTILVQMILDEKLNISS
jgi:hypothetical protein